jgi:hypothetical protein
MRVAGIVLLAAGILLTGGAWFVQGQVTQACSTQEAQTGLLLGDPDAQACRSYPPALNAAMLGGVLLAAVGGVLQLRRT